MICRRATYFTDLEMIKYYQKTCDWNSKFTKTKNYIRNYARYTMLKIIPYGSYYLFMLRQVTVMRISK